MFMLMRRIKLALVAAALVALIAVLFANVTNVQASLPGESDPMDKAADLPLDHFWCYHTGSTPVNEVVGLQDQFHTALLQVTVGKPKIFCNPAEKKHGDKTFAIKDENAHLLMYQIGIPQAQTLQVEVRNQFGKKRLNVFEPSNFIAVPTKKDQHQAPQDLDHFQCYRVTGQAINVQVGLRDQFQQNAAITVGKPVMLCNPARKVHGNKTFEAKHPKAHLVCYNVTTLAFSRSINTDNQFRAEQLRVKKPYMLCAPSKKQIKT